MGLGFALGPKTPRTGPRSDNREHTSSSNSECHSFPFDRKANSSVPVSSGNGYRSRSAAGRSNARLVLQLRAKRIEPVARALFAPARLLEAIEVRALLGED